MTKNTVARIARITIGRRNTKSGGEDKKIKGGSKAREEAGLKELDHVFELTMERLPEEFKKGFVEAKEMCEKKGKKGKVKRRSGGNSGSGRAKK